MKSNWMVIGAALAAVLACAFWGSTAQAQLSTFKVNIPFEFDLANRTLPAGEYQFVPHVLPGRESGSVYIVRNSHVSGVSGFVSTSFKRLPGPATQTGVFFHRTQKGKWTLCRFLVKGSRQARQRIHNQGLREEHEMAMKYGERRLLAASLARH